MFDDLGRCGETIKLFGSLCLLDCTPVESLFSDEKRCLDLGQHDNSKVEEAEEEEHDRDTHEGVWLYPVSNVHIVESKTLDSLIGLC